MNESSGITGWEQGGIRDSGTLLDSATRIRTASTLQFPENTIGQVNITVAAGFAFGYREYRTAAGTGFISGDYATRFYTGSNSITVDLSHYYKFIIKKTDESTITPSDVDSTTLVYSINSIDNTLTESNKVPDSKAVGDAISAVNAKADNVYSLLRGTGVTSGADLNDYTTPGTYYVGSSSAAANIINGPLTSTSYKLVVENTISTSRIKQTVVLNSDKAGFERFYNGTTWSAWKRFAFVEPVVIHPKWEIGNISLSVPWNTNNASVARTALDCIPIGEKTVIRFDPAQIKVSIRLYNQQGKYLVQASGSSTYFDNYNYSADWNTSGEITITANNTIRYYRICVAYISGAAVENPDVIGNLVTIEKYGTSTEFCVDMNSVPINPESAIDRSRPQFGTICAIKELHRQNEQDKTVGYLYRDNKAPFNFYYASGTPENPKKIFTWDATITDTGTREPMDYCFAVTEEGDVIAVFRGEINGNSSQSGPVRGNPIVYPHDDYDHPVVVDLSANIQPTSWLMNTGIYCETGAIYFVEYTRPRHDKAYLWKVTAPYKSASDWTVKYTYDTTDGGQVGTGDIEHWHHITRDPFTQVMYASTGDEDFESKILYSTDNGNNWAVLREGDQKICRQLNFVFLKDAVYWATDAVSTAAPRVLCKTTRDANGLLKLSDNDVEILFTFSNYVAFATYHVCYISNPEGLVLLERSDSKNASYIGTFFFWDFATARLYYAGSFEPNGSVYVGFRNEAVSHYPALPDDNRVMCGFSMFPNEIKYRGNPSVADYLGARGVILSDAYNDDLYNNLVLEVKPLTDYHYNGNQ